MEEASSDKDTNVSLTYLQASRYPLMRRLDQQFALESKFSDYQKEISRVSSKNKVALSSLDYQERRLKEMQALLRSSSSMQAERTTGSRLERSAANIPPAPNYQHRNLIPDDPVSNIDQLEPSYEYGVTETQPTTAQTAVNDGTDWLIAEEESCPQTDIREKATNEASHAPCAPDAPANFLATEIRHDSFTVLWDVILHDSTIVDYELKYIHTGGGEETLVLQRCSRWCLKDPVPNGRFVVQDLEPSTDYRDIAIRCLRRVGWSNFSDPIECITTASKPSKDEDFEHRRSRFVYRIGYIERSIESLESARQQIPAQQVLLSQKMSQTEKRVFQLNEEIERVVTHDESQQLSSDLLHGASQVFTKAALRRQLEQEVVICNENIAGWRADIIDMDKESSDLAAQIQEQTNRLGERKAALHRFDRQHRIVSGMKVVVSKKPNDMKKYYIAKWRSSVADRLDMRKTLDSIARSCRRRICARAWGQLSSLVASRRKLVGNGSIKAPDGVGGVLLGVAENCVREDLADASHLINQLDDIEQNQEGKLATIDTCPTHLLCTEDSTSLTKGDFLFNAGYYDSALKSFQLVLGKMESRDCFSGLTPADAAALYAHVNGKVGHVHIKLESFDLALVYFGRQLSLADEEDLDEPRADALIGLGICYHEKYDHKYAESFFKRALELYKSRGDKAREVNAYGHLQKCCECLNRPADAAVFATKILQSDTTSWDRECGGTMVSRRGVEHAKQDLDSMRSRLVSVVARKAKVINLEVVTARFVQSLRAKSNKEQQLREASEHLSETKESAEELQDLIEQIEDELFEAKNTKKNRLVSGLLQGHNQQIRAAELMFRLQEERRIVGEKLDEFLTEISQTEMLIHNTKDDIQSLGEEMVVENCSLMKHVLKGRKYRCIGLNSSNVACDDVTGKSKGGIASVTLSEGESCYVHSLETGKMEHVFIGDEEGSTATITSLFFYGDRVYTGTMDCVLIGWDISVSKKLFLAKGHESAITCIHADDSKVVSGSADKCIIVWSTDGALICRVGGHARGIHCIQCGPGWCVSASYGTIFVWDVVTKKDTDEVQGFKRRCRLVSEGNITALQHGELELITGDSLGAVSVWWMESGELLKKFDAHDGPISSLQVDSTKGISCGLDMTVRVSNIIRGEVLHTLRGHSAPVLGVAFDRRRIISLSSDGELRYWFWENPYNHSERSESKVGVHAEQNEPNLCGDVESDNHVDATEHEALEEVCGGSGPSATRPSETKGSLMNRLVKFPFRRR